MGRINLEIADDQQKLMLESLQLNHDRYSRLRDEAARTGLGSIGPRDRLTELEELMALLEEA